MQEEKKTDENSSIGGASIDLKKRGADGKAVLETLDRINAVRSIVGSMQQQQSSRHPNQHVISSLENSIGNLRQEHTLSLERHHYILMECGLHDIDRFLDDPPATASDEQEGVQQSNGGRHDATIPLIQKYIDIRDAMRRRSHKISMLHRQNSLFEIISDLQFSSAPGGGAGAASASSSSSSKSQLTQVKNVQRTLSTIQKFVQMHQHNIGSHPFLEGLYRIVHLQLHPNKPDDSNNTPSTFDPTYVVRWKFLGSVLTEACRSCSHGNDSDELAYAREAIQVLFSFLIWIKDIDVEGGGLIMNIEEDANDMRLDQILNNSTHEEEQAEPILSFEVDKYLSNANLKRILSVLPDPKRLDARATGSVEIMSATGSVDNIIYDGEGINNNPVSRKNVDGREDEQWPWFARLDFCTLL